ncbi:hypothetical protein TWF718_006495 [Orbilia javanica]|uniref:Uncharacterized protein n=1 Tax=Orbilia javanica TaxID=47235 RepID=A0AAN8MR81_9PEZI
MFVSLLRFFSAFYIFRSLFSVSHGLSANFSLVAVFRRIFLFVLSIVSGPAQGKVVGATYFLASTHPRSVVYRNWEPELSFAAGSWETINLLDTVWRSPLHQLTPQGRTLKGMEVAAMALFIMATLLPKSFGRICRAISGLAWRLVATGWQRLPQLSAGQRPRAPTARRCRPAAPNGPGPLERFAVLVQQETLAWVQQQDLAGHGVGLSAALLLALDILSFYLGEGVLVLKRASQRAADGRWTPLINMVFRRQPVGGRRATGEGHEELDSLWTPPYAGPVPFIYRMESVYTTETWEAHLEEVRSRFPWRLASMATPLYLRGFYLPPEYRVRRPPPPPPPSSPPPPPIVSVVARPPPTTGFPAVHITAPPPQPPLAPSSPMEVEPAGAQFSVPSSSFSFSFSFAAPTTQPNFAAPPPPPPPAPLPLPQVVPVAHGSDRDDDLAPRKKSKV